VLSISSEESVEEQEFISQLFFSTVFMICQSKATDIFNTGCFFH